MLNILIQLGILIIGFAMLVKGADFFVDGACVLATKLGISQLVIGLTIVAMGTSAPEAAVSISAAIKGSADITLGNVIGSNILNVWLILGITSLIIPLAITRASLMIDIPVMLGVTILLLVLGYDGLITFSDGIILMVAFLSYMGYLLYVTKTKPQEPPEEPHGEMAIWKAMLCITVGLVMIIAGSDFTVDAASAIARIANMSERLIALTIVAFGTSLPELVTSVTAARKGNADIAIGNIVGSNIFNISFLVMLTSLIIPVPFAPKFRIDVMVTIFSGLTLWVMGRKGVLQRWHGVAMLLCYAAYFAFVM